jgi:chemotaxis response regulator CheB
VLEAADGLTIEADHIYVMPPDREMALSHRALRLT